MRKLALALTLAAMPVMAQAQPYVAKGWVPYDKQDTDGKWHLGARDKRGHFLAGALAGSWAYMYAEKHGWRHPEWWGIAASFIAGYLKELYDLRYGSGTAERADVLWTGLGGFTGIALVKIKW
jgi:uncharacterized protein YfiM (DUF2279 family)